MLLEIERQALILFDCSSHYERVHCKIKINEVEVTATLGVTKSDEAVNGITKFVEQKGDRRDSTSVWVINTKPLDYTL